MYPDFTYPFAVESVVAKFVGLHLQGQKGLVVSSNIGTRRFLFDANIEDPGW